MILIWANLALIEIMRDETTQDKQRIQSKVRRKQQSTHLPHDVVSQT